MEIAGHGKGCVAGWNMMEKGEESRVGKQADGSFKAFMCYRVPGQLGQPGESLCQHKKAELG